MSISEPPVRLLICDDSEVTYFGLKCTLDREFSVVGYAKDGKTAVEIARELRPDVVLMDIGMPLVNGIDAAREIKKLLPNVHIIMLTSSEDEESVAKAVAAGATGYCLKSLFSEELITAIKCVARGGGWFDPGVAGRVLPALARRNRGGEDSPEGKLSKRELEVLSLMAAGLTNEEIAKKLVLSIDTVKTHARHIYEKLDVRDRTQAALVALRHGIVADSSV